MVRERVQGRGVGAGRQGHLAALVAGGQGGAVGGRVVGGDGGGGGIPTLQVGFVLWHGLRLGGGGQVGGGQRRRVVAAW